MDKCECGKCMCGGGIEIESKPQEDSGMNNLWKTPTIYPYTDGKINE